jgi:hypothetical protein
LTDFDRGPEDIRLAELLARACSSDFQEAMTIYGKVAHRVAPMLIATAARRGSSSPAAVAEDAIENGLKRIKAVFEGTMPENGLRYRSDISIASWLVLLIGDPG